VPKGSGWSEIPPCRKERDEGGATCHLRRGSPGHRGPLHDRHGEVGRRTLPRTGRPSQSLRGTRSLQRPASRRELRNLAAILSAGWQRQRPVIFGRAVLSPRPFARGWTSAPFPPSPPLRDQHAVVHGYNALCICAPCWAYAVQPGSNRLMPPASPDRHCPAVGSCSLLVAATTYSSNRLLIQQRGQPIRFLNPRVEFPILLREFVRLSLSRGNTHRADVFHFGARRPTLRS
jgi:hypothetical protein